MLCEVTDRQAFAGVRFAGQRRQFAGNRFDQRRFAGTINAQEADALADLQRKIDAGDDRFFGDAIVGFIFNLVTRIDVFLHQQRVWRA